jgi:hypothetical protein
LVEGSGLIKIPHQILKEAYKAGIEGDERNRSGTFMHIDQATVYSKVNAAFKDKLEMMDTKEALRKYAWLDNYNWKLIDKDKDDFTRKVADEFSGGYFMRILPNTEVVFPLQSCLMITRNNLEQRVHNIIIAEEGSKARVITSCVQHLTVESSTHLGISEFYVKKGAKLNFTMIHNWGEKTLVRPRSAALVEDGGEFVSNYLCLKPVRNVQMYPVAFCNGEYSKASFNNILFGQSKSLLDVGSKAVLNGRYSRTEMISRAIARKGSKIFVRGIMDGNNSTCKGHLECRGLLLDSESRIHAIPELIARKEGAELSHEAAVGKISEKEITYLMTRKLTEDEAISTIIRGFMDASIMGLPQGLTKEINQIIDLTAEAH